MRQAPVDFDPIAYINEPRWRHSSLGLERITMLLDMLGNPQDDFASVHVAGTNGKGSTCAFLSSVLRACGQRTGLFTSPFLERFEERIQVDGCMVSMRDLTSSTLQVKDAAEEVERVLGEHPTEFELMCAVAFVHFASSGCDVAVVECGLGGRLDATNVVSPVLSVITRIGLDHTDVLGGTLAKIAFEKAGIVKRGVPVVSFPQDAEAARVIEERCLELGSPLFVSDFSELLVRGNDASERGHAALSDMARGFSYRGVSYETQLLAAYQPRNAAVAIDAATVLAARHPELGVDELAIRRGIASARWPGRFEVVSTQPLVIVDGAHNPDGAAALALSVEELLDGDGQAATLVIGVLADKDVPNIVAPMLPYASRFVVYAPDNPRALPAEDLAAEVRRQAQAVGREVCVQVASSAAQAIRCAVKEEGPEGFVVAFGTLYSIGSMKRELATRPWE